MSKIVVREIKKLKKSSVHILDALFICKKLDDKLTLKKFLELWRKKLK